LSPSSYAAAGREITASAQVCPSCSHQLTGWGGYWRWVRAERRPEQRIWIQRGWCAHCRHAEALLPSFLLVRRLDEDAVIGSALSLAAGGTGARAIAQQLAVPRSTVRDWWRRACARAPTLLASLLALATSLDPAPVALTADGLVGVLEALENAWERARQHLGARLPDRWGFWSLISGGLALAAHTSPPLPGGSGASKVRASP
jgi:hypothetical protein